MPDWSYQPLFRPLLFRLEAARARDLTLSAMDRLSRLPLGPQLIEFMGHMRPPESLRRESFGVAFATPVGLDAGLDPGLLGIQPLSQFGFGYVEVGPLTVSPVSGPPVRRLTAEEGIWYPDLPVNPGLAAALVRLRRTRSRAPLGMRLGSTGAAPAATTADWLTLVRALRDRAAFFTLEARPGLDWPAAAWADGVGAVVRAAGRPVLVALPPDAAPDTALAIVTAALAGGAAGAVISGGVAAMGGRLEGRPARAPALALLRRLRAAFPLLPLVAGGGIHDPGAALDFLAAGATLVHVHAGLVYSGPGLPKRINEAVAHRHQHTREAELPPARRAAAIAARGRGWLPAALMAVTIAAGAALATWIALTRVVLPYDEAFVGLARDQLAALNPRLLPFMTHDRISLSGTMGASALLYWAIACFPWRQGEHWARPAYLIPAAAGFLSFFTFVGTGYFEPLHALFYLALVPLFLLALLRRPQGEPAAMPAGLHNDAAWRRGLWGQLLWLVLAAGGTVAGLTIMAIGVTRVFVPADLAFMQTTAAALQAVPRLVPLIAHDRVGFGTALTCNGLTVLLLALWGYRRGARWLWWTLAAAGLPSYIGAFGTHLAVGYTDLWHLTPPMAGLVVLAAALVLSYPYLMAPETHSQRRPDP